MEVVDTVKNLIEEGFNHALRDLNRRLLAAFDSSMELDDMLGRGRRD